MLYRNHFGKEVKWIKAKIIRRLSKFIYCVNINNKVRNSHVNDLKKFRKHVDLVLEEERKNVRNSLEINKKNLIADKQDKLNSQIIIPTVGNNAGDEYSNTTSDEIEYCIARDRPRRKIYSKYASKIM